MSASLRHPPWTGSPPTLDGDQVYLRAPQLTDWAEWARLRTASREFLTPWEPTWAEDELTRTAFRRRIRRYHRDARDGNLLTVAEVAQRLHAHPHSVRRWADGGLLNCYRIGIRGDRRFQPDDVHEFLVAQTNGH